MKQRFILVTCLAVLLVVCGMTRRAEANGRFPASNAIAFDPNDPKTVYIRATFGLLVTHDAGETWHWVCEKAIGFSGMEDPTYIITPKGTLVSGTFSGVAVSRDKGCSWSFSGGPGKHVLSDLAMRSDGELVGMSSSYKKAGDGGSVYDNHLVFSKDDAENFTGSGGPIDPTLILESVEIAESDPARLYLSAVRGEGAQRTAAFLVSYDVGLSWTERKFEIVPGETAPFIAIVDPKNADRVYVRTAGAVDSKSRLLVTDDAGKTWRKIFESPSQLLGFALAHDGSKVFAGAKEGLVSSPTNEMTFSFTRGSNVEIQCLGATKTNELWACSSEKNGFFVGLSKHSGGKGFDAKLHLDGIKGPLECGEGTSVVKECTAEWPKLRRELGLPDPDEKPRTTTSGPAMRGRAAPVQRSRSTLSTVAGIAFLAAVAYLGYTVLTRFRKRP